MTFPSQADIGIYASGGGSADHSANYPASVSDGQCLLYVGGCDGGGDTPTITGVTGINLLASHSGGSHGTMIYWKEADGTEGGTTFNVHVTSGEDVVAYCMAIDDWDGITAPEISTLANATSASPDPNSLTPSWGALDTLWYAFFAKNSGSGASAYPTNYDSNQQTNATSSNGAGIASREVNAATEDPGAFTIGSDTWSAYTIAIKPLVPLVDTGLLVRYYFDEAASGTGPTAVLDRSGSAYDLDTIDYDGANGAYVEVSGNRGLENTGGTNTDVRADHTIHDTSDLIRDALVGSKTATIELVIRVDAVTSDVSRVFGINDRAGSNGAIIVTMTSIGNLRVSLNDVQENENTMDVTSRAVVHMVLDTNLTGNDRVKWYLNGVFDGSPTVAIAQDATLAISAGSDLIAMNRYSGTAYDRCFDGVSFYAAVYSGALTAEQVFINNSVLQLDDDYPSSPTSIDTQQKRMSVVGVGRPYMRSVFPVAGKTAPWRMNVGETYSGNALGAPPASEAGLLSMRHIKNLNRDLTGGMR